MNQAEEIHELDQSPHSYRVVHGAISEDNKILIEDIRLRYNYKGNLFQYLITLPSWVNSYTDVKRQHGRAKKQKALYMKTMKTAEKLREYMGYFSGKMRGEIIQKLGIKKPTTVSVDEIAEAAARKLKEA